MFSSNAGSYFGLSRSNIYDDDEATNNLVALLAEARLNESTLSAATVAESLNSSLLAKENISSQESLDRSFQSLSRKSSVFSRLSTNSDGRPLLSKSPRRIRVSRPSSKTPQRLSQPFPLSDLSNISAIASSEKMPKINPVRRQITTTPASSPQDEAKQLPAKTPSRPSPSPTLPAWSPSQYHSPPIGDRSMEELEEIGKEREFEFLKVIGKGSFGKVLLAQGVQDRKVVAVKILDRKKLLERGNLRRAHCEIRCLEKCDSRFIVKLQTAFETKTKIFIVQEFCMGGELFSVLSRFKRLNATAVTFYAAQCALALEHLHERRYAYRDLKTENIMLDRSGHVRLVDFGLVKEGIVNPERGGRSFVGTTEYLAPEVILRKGHGWAIDWWALGVVIHELLTGLPPWYVNNALEMQRRIVYDPLSLSSSSLPETSRPTIAGLLDKSPLKRLGSREGLKSIQTSPFFRSLDWSAMAEAKVPAPFLPVIEHEKDVKYFSEEFLNMRVEI